MPLRTIQVFFEVDIPTKIYEGYITKKYPNNQKELTFIRDTIKTILDNSKLRDISDIEDQLS